MIADFSPQEAQWLNDHWAELSPGERAVIARRIQAGDVTPLPGAELSWQDWLDQYCADAVRYPLADHHIAAWDWFDGLQSGVRPPSLFAAFARGHGKSTTAELGVVRCCVKGTRRFALYVKAALESASKHIYTIARRFEKIGVDRQVNKYGLATGWNAQQLTTANGFSVLSFGVDGALRGIKLEQFRPDIIIIDDVDELGDSMAEILRKIEAISNSILPAGSDDMAVGWFQNPQQPNSAMSQVLDGRADMLKNRILLGPIPAVRDLVYEPREDPDKVTRHYILSGEATWAGKPIATCQQEIHDYGISAFLRECQHDIYSTGVFFTNWSDAKHIRLPNASDGVCESCLGDPQSAVHCMECYGRGQKTRAPWLPPSWWQYYGGLDYGRNERNPFAFLLIGVDHHGDAKLLEEILQPSMAPEQQAAEVKAKLAIYGLAPSQVPIYCDPSFFPKAASDEVLPIGSSRPVPGWSMFTNNGKHVSDIYLGEGLRVLPAMSANTHEERINGWVAVNQYLDRPGGLTVYEGRCPNFVRAIRIAPRSPLDGRDVDTKSDDHLLDCFRFFARNKYIPSGVVPTPEKPLYVPAWMRNKKKAGYA